MVSSKHVVFCFTVGRNVALQEYHVMRWLGGVLVEK